MSSDADNRPRRRWRRVAAGLLIVIALVYGAVTAVAYLNQDRFVFVVDPRPFPLAEAGLEGFTEVAVPTPDGERLVGWWRPPPPGQGAVLYFHGNAGGLRYRAERLDAIAEAGMGALVLAYRGYSGSSGRPSERALLADARTAYAWLAERTPAEKTALFGESLGTGVAVALAAERPVGGLVLDSPYASMTRLGERLLPGLPVRWLTTNRFNSEARIADVEEPMLFVHCDGDATIPIGEGRRLYARAKAPRVFDAVPGCGHIGAWYDDPTAKARMIAALQAFTQGRPWPDGSKRSTALTGG